MHSYSFFIYKFSRIEICKLPNTLFYSKTILRSKNIKELFLKKNYYRKHDCYQMHLNYYSIGKFYAFFWHVENSSTFDVDYEGIFYHFQKNRFKRKYFSKKIFSSFSSFCSFWIIWKNKLMENLYLN